MDRIRIGVLGCSAIAAKAVIPAIINNGNFDLKFVASRSPEKASDYAARFDTAPCGYDALLASNEVDAVYVSLPVGLHAEWGEKVIASGKHLLMEKVFTADYRSAKAIVDLAERKQLVAMEGLMYVYHPVHQMVDRIIAEGKIGAVRSMEAAFGFPFLADGDIRNDPDLGGGAILDNMIYPLSRSLSVLGGGYDEVHYQTVMDRQRGIDARGFIQLFGNGMVASVTYGFGFMYRNEYLIWGEDGYLKVDRAFSRPGNFSGSIQLIRQGASEEISVPPADQFALMLDAFSGKIAGTDMSGINEKEELLKRMELISRIYKSTSSSR